MPGCWLYDRLQSKCKSENQSLKGGSKEELATNGPRTVARPMNMRKDPVVCAAKIILEVEWIANKHGGQGTNERLGLNGTAQAHNYCILGQVELGLDLRHKDEAQLKQLAVEVESKIKEIAEEMGG